MNHTTTHLRALADHVIAAPVLLHRLAALGAWLSVGGEPADRCVTGERHWSSVSDHRLASKVALGGLGKLDSKPTLAMVHALMMTKFFFF